MTGLQAAYAAPLALSVLTCAVVLVLVWQRRRASNAVRAFAWAVLGQVLWGAGYIGELFATTLAGKQLWDVAQVLPSYLVGLEVFRFALSYTGSELLESRRAMAALWAIPVVHLLVVYTSPLHGAAYHDARLIPGPAFDALIYSFTPLDQLGYAYLALLGIAGAVLLLRWVLRQRRAYRPQLLPLAIALLLPVVSMLLLLLGVKVLGQRDSAPYAFAVSSVIVAHTLLRRRLFDLNPIANEAVVSASPQAVLVVDEAGRVVEANPALIRLLEQPSEPVGLLVSDAVPWAAPALDAEPWQPVDIELSSDRIVEARGAPLLSRSGHPVGRVLTFQDVTLTRQAARLLKQQNEALEARVRERTLALDRSRQQLRDVLDQAFQLMGILELDGTITHANRAALDMIGKRLEDVLGKKFWETPWWAHSAEEQHNLKAAIERAARGELVRFSTTHHDSAGQVRHIDFSIKPVLDAEGRATVLVPEGRDVTDLRRADEQRRVLEQQLAQAHKVESLGRLAGGVAHDFNNLLTAILANVELTRMDLPAGSPVLSNLDEIQHASESAKELVQQLLVFTRKPSSEVAVVDVRSSIETTIRMLSRLVGEDVTIASRLTEQPLQVRIDPRQLERVLVNLAVNARDAMPQGGKLSIALDVVGEPGKRRARIVVSDTGSGMSREVLGRIFEPFFTTKPAGKGTGLGLALAFAVVKQAGGEITVESQLGSGTSFTIELPEEAAQPTAEVPRPITTLPGGKETLLFVEDQEELSRVAQTFLRRLGYTVHAFRTGEEVLASPERVPRADLLLSDVVLPGMSGPVLADQLSKTQPWLRVLFASGYHEKALADRSPRLAMSRVLAKPFSLEELARAIRTTLEEPPS